MPPSASVPRFVVVCGRHGRDGDDSYADDDDGGGGDDDDDEDDGHGCVGFLAAAVVRRHRYSFHWYYHCQLLLRL